MDDNGILSYYEGIKQLDAEKDIRKFLPSTDYPAFNKIMAALTDKINEDLKELYEILQYETNDEEREMIKHEIELYKLKLNICNEKVALFKMQNGKLQEFSQSPQKNIIFAQSSKGNILFEQDLKRIPEEYYSDIVTVLTDFQNGNINEGNTTKIRKLSNNRSLYGLHEIKIFKIRIIFRILDHNTVYVIQTKMKKSDNNSVDINELSQRKTQTNQEYETLKAEIQDENFKSKLIAEHEGIMKRLKNELSSRQR